VIALDIDSIPSGGYTIYALDKKLILLDLVQLVLMQVFYDPVEIFDLFCNSPFSSVVPVIIDSM